MWNCNRNSYLLLLQNIKKGTFHSKNRYCSYHINDTEKSVEIDLADGERLLTLSTKQSGRNVQAYCNAENTSVLAVVVSEYLSNSTAAGFTPFTVDYQFNDEAAGRITPGFITKPISPVLTSRLIDRSLRPLFPADFNNETHVVCNVLAYDSLNGPQAPSINAASLALAVSDVPWNGPVGAVRVGLIDDAFVLNPTQKQLKESRLDLFVTGNSEKSVVMIEGKADIIPYHKVYSALQFGLKACDNIVKAIDAFAEKFGKPKQQYKKPEPIDAEVVGAIQSLAEMPLVEVFQNYGYDKTSRGDAMNKIRQNVLDHISSMHPNLEANTVANEYDKAVKKIFREITFNGKRCDGREHNQLRNISCSVDLFKPLHGSSLFERGQTQVMATVALVTPFLNMRTTHLNNADRADNADRFWLDYEFPPYATGEVGAYGRLTRREIGHGRLAENALYPVIPDNHPFTIKVSAEVMESNGSSSMATVCAGSLALMDAGVPIKNAVAGVAIGLITKYDADNPKKLIDYRILTDIMGMEDFLGDLDMKIASTSDGITAIQADIKINGLPIAIVNECMERAHAAKKEILEKMTKCAPAHRTVPKNCWPVTKLIEVDPIKVPFLRRSVKLGKYIEMKNAKLYEMEPFKFTTFAKSQKVMDEIEKAIGDYLETLVLPNLKRGEIHRVKIVGVGEERVLVQFNSSPHPFAVFLEELDDRIAANPTVLGFKVGQTMFVKCNGIDPETGDALLSRKELYVNK